MLGKAPGVGLSLRSGPLPYGWGALLPGITTASLLHVLRLCLDWIQGMQEGRVSSPTTMKDRDKTEERKRFAGTNLVREVSYVHEDEARALDERAKKERTSKSEIIRRALRAYLGIED